MSFLSNPNLTPPLARRFLNKLFARHALMKWLKNIITSPSILTPPSSNSERTNPDLSNSLAVS